MIFNFTTKYQFTTRLSLNDEMIEVLNSTKLLGTIISDDLRWDLNTANIVKKANARMQLLRKVKSFSPPVEDLKNIYFLFIRSLLEQSATVWHSSLTEENSHDLERVQKSALRIILGEGYIGYKKSLEKLDMESLNERREQLCLSLQSNVEKIPKQGTCFLKTVKYIQCKQEIRKYLEYSMKNSPIIYMQNLLNENDLKTSH